MVRWQAWQAGWTPAPQRGQNAWLGCTPAPQREQYTMQRFAQNEVENDADAVEKKDGEQGPHDVAHAAPAGIAVDVADQQGVAGEHHRKQDRDEQLDESRCVVLADKDHAEKQKPQQENDAGGDPASQRDHSFARGTAGVIRYSFRDGGGRPVQGRQRRPTRRKSKAQTSHAMRGGIAFQYAQHLADQQDEDTGKNRGPAGQDGALAAVRLRRRHSAVVRLTRSAGGWGAGSAESPADSAA